MKRLPAQFAPLAAVGAIVIVAALAAWQVLGLIGLPLSKDEYNLAAWEVRHLPDKWLYMVGHIGDGSSRDEENADVLRYLQLQRETDALQAELSRQSATNAAPDELHATSQRLQQTRGERDATGNRAQAILEGRISSIASGLGIETTLPLFSRVHWLFPPVDFEFEDPPHVLVISPRDRIVEEKATLLRSDLTLDEAQRLEREAEAKSDNVSALVVPTGGISAYPAIIEPTDDYLSALQVASHEWMHAYLFFHPLGARYFENDTLRTINETVADIVGMEMGSLVEAAYPLAAPTPAPAATPQPSQESVDVDKVLRQLRLNVDGLLAQGRTVDAETAMEQTRKFLAAHGRYYRRINQAFFAFYGLYGTSAASSSPIGPKLEELRERSASLGDFVRAVAGVRSEADLDRLLAEAGATPP
ncbi:MAG TPA: hypothetical protein VM013_03110 [Dehalococcoidia bacterium]|nr:hypothetical protein [Dehalococcoidia bacterium]